MPPSGKALKSGYTAPAASNQPHREPFRSGTWRFSEVSTPRARHAVATLRHYLSGRRLHRCGRPAHAGRLAHQTRSVGLGHERAVLFRSRRGRRLSKCLRGHRSLDPGARRTRAWGHRVDDQSGRRRFVAPAGRADSDSIWWRAPFFVFSLVGVMRSLAWYAWFRIRRMINPESPRPNFARSVPPPVCNGTGCHGPRRYPSLRCGA